MTAAAQNTIVTTKVRLRTDGGAMAAFADWQAKLNAAIAVAPGFVSFEVLSTTEAGEPIWTIVQRFRNGESVTAWQGSLQRQQLMRELQALVINDGKEAIKEAKVGVADLQGGVTEVFITQVSPENEEAYRQWIAKIHHEEAKFPGFKGMYVQSPVQAKGQNWITLLQFDTPENLDRWLSSPERQKVLHESKQLIEALESHRVISPYAGWFASIAKEGKAPSVWKETMLVLLVLFPIVMLESIFLSPQTAQMNPALGMFIGNMISVTLIAWPAMPIAIWFLGWWLSPPAARRLRTTLIGAALVIGLYLLEIAIFWKL